MTDVGAWADKLAIRELLERYMRYNDDGAADAVAELFDENAVLQVVGSVVAGREAIRAFFGGGKADSPRWTEPGELLKQPRSAHISSNPVIEIDGDTATAETDFVVVRRDEGGRAGVALVGRYRDRLRRLDDGRWVIASRTAVSVARPGEEGTDAEWQRAMARMPNDVRAQLRL